jgi:hypothetical protein
VTRDSFIKAFLAKYSKGGSETTLQVLTLIMLVVEFWWAGEISTTLLLEVLQNGEPGTCCMTVNILRRLRYCGLVVLHF